MKLTKTRRRFARWVIAIIAVLAAVVAIAGLSVKDIWGYDPSFVVFIVVSFCAGSLLGYVVAESLGGDDEPEAPPELATSEGPADPRKPGESVAPATKHADNYKTRLIHVTGLGLSNNDDGYHRDADRKFPVELLTRDPDVRSAYSEVHLSHASLIRGADVLLSHLRSPKIGACIGINSGGLFIATCLAKHLGVSREFVGTMLLDLPDESGQRALLPALPDRRGGRILLVESQLKTGGASGQAFKKLLDHYKDHGIGPEHIWYVVLVIGGVDTKLINRLKENGGPVQLKRILDVRTAECAQPNRVSHIPDRVVFFTPGRLELPDGLF